MRAPSSFSISTSAISWWILRSASLPLAFSLLSCLALSSMAALLRSSSALSLCSRAAAAASSLTLLSSLALASSAAASSSSCLRRSSSPSIASAATLALSSSSRAFSASSYALIFSAAASSSSCSFAAASRWASRSACLLAPSCTSRRTFSLISWYRAFSASSTALISSRTSMPSTLALASFSAASALPSGERLRSCITALASSTSLLTCSRRRESLSFSASVTSWIFSWTLPPSLTVAVLSALLLAAASRLARSSACFSSNRPCSASSASPSSRAVRIL
mmetsp:Transcript_7549/g.19349  ORF Transcript_7549/g.19349 Transcript_7549/m.19349 type:complete len:280 (-) Transcript_7549:1014-1853(-)